MTSKQKVSDKIAALDDLKGYKLNVLNPEDFEKAPNQKKRQSITNPYFYLSRLVWSRSDLPN